VGDRCGHRAVEGNKRLTAASRRYVGAWFAIFCLYIQLAATAACAAGSPLSLDSGFADLSQSPFPICSSESSDDSSAQVPNGDHSPAHHHACPFCAVHCHAVMAPAPVLASLETLFAVPVNTDRSATFIFPSPARFRAGAPPRGPPFAA
jgi:Protein of unknown function (DUF2946)